LTLSNTYTFSTVYFYLGETTPYNHMQIKDSSNGILMSSQRRLTKIDKPGILECLYSNSRDLSWARFLIAAERSRTRSSSVTWILI